MISNSYSSSISSEEDYSTENDQDAEMKAETSENKTMNLYQDKEFYWNKYRNNTNASTLRRNLEQNLRTDLNTLLKSEYNFYQKNKSIIMNEEVLIDECLMLLSGLKPHLVFLFIDGEVIFNSKFQLKSLNKEIAECLEDIIYYSKIICKLEKFVSDCVKLDSYYTQIYESFSQCIIEYLNYFKNILNEIGSVLLKKEKKFTLIDFVTKISTPFFGIFDLLDLFLNKIENDVENSAYEKSSNLLEIIQKKLIDSYTISNDANINSMFLMWLFVHTIRPYLNMVDSIIQDGSNHDIYHEFGFKRNLNVQINDPDYWGKGFEIISKKDTRVPNFIQIIVKNAFKISKHMEIIKLLDNFNKESKIFANFLNLCTTICPFLKDVCQNQQNSIEIKNCVNLTFLELNTQNLKDPTTQNNNENKQNTSVTNLIQIIFRQNILSSYDTNIMKLNFEHSIDSLLNHFLTKNLKWCSNILIEKFFEKFHMIKFLEFMHSFYLHKSNEIMFIFGNKLFDAIKNYELYQEDAILNNFFYNSANSVFTTNDSFNKSQFDSNSITLHYDNSKVIENQSLNLSSRLVLGISIRMNIKWPFNIIIKNSDVNSYNRLFLFIMQIKQTKHEIDNLSLKEMDYKFLNEKKKKNIKNPFLKTATLYNEKSQQIASIDENVTGEKVDPNVIGKMFLIRFKIMNFINNAHDLICNQIYESEEAFLKKLNSQSSIDEIISIHEEFLSKILKNCMLDNKQFQKVLLQVFNFTLQFCELWRKGIKHFTLSVQPIVLDIEKHIDIYFEFAYKILSSLVNKNLQTHFQPLIASMTLDGVNLNKNSL